VMSPNSRPTFPGEVQGGYKDRKARADNRRRRAWYLRAAPSPFSARCYSLRSEGHRSGPAKGAALLKGEKKERFLSEAVPSLHFAVADGNTLS
jgi:hypothetical protein